MSERPEAQQTFGYSYRVLREQRDRAQGEARRLRDFARLVANTDNPLAGKAREVLGMEATMTDLETKAKRRERLGAAIDRLAGMVPSGDLLAATDPADLLNVCADMIEAADSLTGHIKRERAAAQQDGDNND